MTTGLREETAADRAGVVGRRLPRIEAAAKATGRARYVADLALPGMLHGRLVRSPYAHASIIRVDESRARSVPGVVEVLSSSNIADHLPDLPPFDLACGAMERPPDQPVMAGDFRIFDTTVRFVGEPVALIVAATEEAAAQAAQELEVEYESLAAVVDPDAALAPGAALVHEGAAGNVSTRMERRLGDVEHAFETAAVVVERTFRTSKQKQAQLEPTGCLAEVDPEGRITVWTPHQAPHRARYTLAKLFGVPANRVRVIVPTVGGAFGKSDALAPEPYAIAGAIVTGHPVRLLFTRQEDFVGTESRHPTRTTMMLALNEDGTIAGIRSSTVVDAGAYLSHSTAITAVLVGHILFSYRIENAWLEAVSVFTNTPVSGAFRGYGGPQASFPLEHLIDLGCTELGVDPLVARRRMRLRAGDPWGYRGDPIAGDGFAACLDRGAAAIGWSAARAAARQDGAKRCGVGMAATMWKSGVVGKAMDHSAAAVRLTPDGTLHLLTAAADLGTGVRTTLAQICADAIGFPIESVSVGENDTDVTPYDTGAFASRSLYRAGQAVEAAGRDLRGKLLAYAAERLEIAPADLELTPSAIFPRDAPDRGVALDVFLRDAYHEGHEFSGHGEAMQTTAPAFAAQFAEVEVDTETGQVNVRRLVAVQDVGRAINPDIVEGQIQGAALQGLGYALTEGVLVDGDTGTVVNGTFMDYRLLTSADSPHIEAILVEEPDPTGPYGARGVGEASIVITAPAIANAILHAVGASPTELPFTPERVLAAIRSGARGGTSNAG